MYKLITFVAAGAVLALVSGCCGGGAKTDAEWEKELDKAFEDAFEEMAKEAEEAVEEVEADAGGGGGPCQEYSRCCTDYIDALGKLPGYPAESVDMAKQGCEAVEQLEGTPGGDEACKTSLDALKQGMDGMSAFPGWETPASCK